jgi:hypothetical protein
MIMDLDRTKRIHAVLLVVEDGEERVVMMLETAPPMVSERGGLTYEHAAIYAEGIKTGLDWASSELIELFKAGKLTLKSQDANPSRLRELFNDGVMEGVKFAASGYWLDLKGYATHSLAH